MKKPSARKKPHGSQPARMPAKPKPPKAPAAGEPEPPVVLLPDDTEERRAAARAHLDAERAAAHAGLEIPDLR